MKKGRLILNYWSNWMMTENTYCASVAISSPPRCRFLKKEYSGLAPSKQLRNAYKYDGLLWEDFVKEYLIQISQSEQAQRDLEDIKFRLDNGEDVTLFCWEKNKKCHRRILGELFLGWEYVVKECMSFGMVDYVSGDYN